MWQWKAVAAPSFWRSPAHALIALICIFSESVVKHENKTVICWWRHKCYLLNLLKGDSHCADYPSEQLTKHGGLQPVDSALRNWLLQKPEWGAAQSECFGCRLWIKTLWSIKNVVVTAVSRCAALNFGGQVRRMETSIYIKSIETSCQEAESCCSSDTKHEGSSILKACSWCSTTQQGDTAVAD